MCTNRLRKTQKLQRFTPTPRDVLLHTDTHNNNTSTQTWKMIQRVFLIWASLLYSAAQCFFSQTLIALTGGIPDGLLHCLHAAAHSGKDKSLSAVHHRLRWKNWLKIPQCTSQCNLQQETTEILLLRNTCDHCNLNLFIPSLFYSTLCFVFCMFHSALFSNCHLQLGKVPYFIFSCIKDFPHSVVPATDTILMTKEDSQALTLQNHFLPTSLTGNYYSSTNTLTQTESNKYKIMPKHLQKKFLALLQTIRHRHTSKAYQTYCNWHIYQHLLSCLLANDANQSKYAAFSPQKKGFIVTSELSDPYTFANVHFT